MYDCACLGACGCHTGQPGPAHHRWCRPNVHHQPRTPIPPKPAPLTPEPDTCGLRCAEATDHGICDRCHMLSGRDLLAQPELIAELHTNRTPSSGHGAKVTGTREEPVPLRLDVVDHMQLTTDQLASWSELIANERRLVGPPSNHITTLVAWLDRHHEWATRQVWAVDYTEEIRRLAHTARALCRLYDEKPEPRRGIPCRKCGLLSLVTPPGTEDVSCSNEDCGDILRKPEYEQWLSNLKRTQIAREAS